jgi:hypothetical protein
VGQYYQVLAGVFGLLSIPIFFMREISSKHVPIHTFAEHGRQLWETLQNPTTLYLLIFVSGNGTFSQFTPVCYILILLSLSLCLSLLDCPCLSYLPGCVFMLL